MRAKMLEGGRLRVLADCKNLTELFRRVKSGATFPGHVQFERELLAEEIRSLDQVSQYLRGRTSRLFQWLMVHYHLENLKTALRVHASGEDVAAAEAIMAPVPAHLSLPLDELFGKADLRRFANALPVPELREALGREIGTPQPLNLFVLDMALDEAYFRRLCDLSWGSDEWTRALVEYDAALRNLLLVFRAKFNHNLELKEIGRFLVPVQAYLGREDVEKIYSESDLTGAIRRIPRSMLPLDVKRAVGSLLQLEDALLLRQYRLAARCFTESPADLPAVIAYAYMKRLEFLNLVRLTEGVRHSLPREEIEGRLVLLNH